MQHRPLHARKETKMNRITRMIVLFFVVSAGMTAAATETQDAELLKVRETVWRAWFANDTKALYELIPADTIVISAGEAKWKNQAQELQAAVDFQAAGGKLIRLEFARTEVQHFGDVAIIRSEYLVETEMKGKRSTSAGRVTEIFVRRNGRWTNPGWHTDEMNTAQGEQQ